MKKKIIIILMILIVLFGLAYYLGRSPSLLPNTCPTIQTFPYIKNDILYTENRQLPLDWITNIAIDTRTVRYIVIEWHENKYHGGLLTMQMWEFEKIRPQLEAYYAKKKR